MVQLSSSPVSRRLLPLLPLSPVQSRGHGSVSASSSHSFDHRALVSAVAATGLSLLAPPHLVDFQWLPARCFCPQEAPSSQHALLQAGLTAPKTSSCHPHQNYDFTFICVTI